MSAFVVSKAHIDLMVAAAVNCELWIAHPEKGSNPPHYVHISPELGDAVGQALWRENVASVNFRYREDELVDVYEYPVWHHAEHARLTLPGLVATLKAIHCYEYQACEHPGWSASWAQEFCHRLRADLCTHLPGYDEAAWETD